MTQPQTQTTGAPAAQGQPALVDTILDQLGTQTPEERSNARTYIEQFVREAVKPGQVISRDVETTVKCWIAAIDQKLSEQLNEVLHDPDFQRLEATWRGLHYLVHNSETGDQLKIRVLNISKRELYRDLEKAIEFDQSELFKKVYEAEYGQLGGEPFGLLVGDYEFGRHPEDVEMLRLISGVAAAAHAPFVATSSPAMFGFERFTELTAPRDLARIFQSVEYTKWKAFRDTEDSRYVALTLPHVLARLPYGKDFKRVDAFDFEEFVDGKDHDKYLWMSAAWAYAARVTEAFSLHGWFAATRGVDGGGRVENLPVHTFPTDDGDVAMKCPTEIAISDRREFELSNLGFLPLLHCKGRDFAAFLGAQSCQKFKEYAGQMGDAATANADLSTKFNFILCVARFAHYLKVMARNWIGQFMEAPECERRLNEWINDYIHPDPANAGPEAKARKPLAAAQITVVADKRRPGWYEAVAHLRPHFQLETLTTSMRLVAELPPPRQG